MKRVFYIGFFLGILLQPQCKKYQNTDHDVSGNNYMAGTVYLYNDYSADGLQTQLTGQTVRIVDTTELQPPNFQYTVTSDTNGGFVFNNLRNGVPYTIFALDTLSGIKFYGAQTNTLTNDQTPINNIVLNLSIDSIHQNGVVYTVTDSTGNLIPNCSVWIFSSPTLAAQMATITGDSCEGCNFTLTTNPFGKAFQVNMAPVTYITLFRYPVGNLVLSGQDTLTLQQFGIDRKSVV